MNDSKSLPTLPVIELRQYGNSGYNSLKIFHALLDTGSSDNLLSLSQIKNTNIKSETLPHPVSLQNAVGFEERNLIHSIVRANIFLPDEDIELINQSFYLIENLEYEAILGIRALSGLTMKFTGREVIISNKISIKDENDYTVHRNSTEISEPHLIANADSTLEMFSETYVKVSKQNCHFPHTDELLAVTCKELAFWNCKVLPKFSSNRKLLKIKNLSDKVVHIEKGAALARLFSVKNENLLPDQVLTSTCNFLIKVQDASRSDQDHHETDLIEWRKRRNFLVNKVSLSQQISKICTEILSQFADGMRDVLTEFNWIFSRASNDSGLSQHYIIDLRLKNTDDGEPTYSKPYRMNPELAHRMNEKIAQMKENLLIETTNSPWNSPTILVPKKGTKDIRLVNNYSVSINQRLLQCRFPIVPPRTVFKAISAFIESIKRSHPNEKIYFTSMDLKNGYYHISLRESQRDMTSFIIGHTQLRYRRLSQGLSLAPSDFSRYMNIVYGGQEFNPNGKFYILIYLDDVAIISAESEHLNAIKACLNRGKKMNLVFSREM